MSAKVQGDEGTRIANWVRGKIRWLDGEEPAARAALAKLRRGLGKGPADSPEIWALTLTWDGTANNSFGVPRGDGGATQVEWAVHTALTLYALHRQGQNGSMSDDGRPDADGKPVRGNSFGAALGVLRRLDANKAPGVVRRFNAAVTADGFQEFSRHALGAVQLLRAAERPVKLDYPAFAADLYRYQQPAWKDGVALTWGRDFWRDFFDTDQDNAAADAPAANGKDNRNDQ